MNRINYPFRLGKAIDDAAPVNTEGKSSDPTSTNVPALGEYVKKQGQEKGKIVIDGGKKIYSDIMSRFGGNKEISSAGLSEDQVRKSDKELPIEYSATDPKFVDQQALLKDDEAEGNLAIKKGKDLLHGRKPELKIMNKKMAPPEENLYKVVMELVGPASGEDRTAVDIIVILDVTGSMKNEKLERLKSAMRILISKLNPTDSLSVISFKDQVFMTQFQLMNINGKKNIERVVNDLRHAENAPNMDGLLAGLLEIAALEKSAIFLMSDGDPSRDYTDAAKIPLPDVPLYKFTFAHEYQADGMYTIGKSNRGGTFPLGNEGDMKLAFSQCFYELSDIVVKDLKLIFTPIMAEFEDSNLAPIIVKVSAGNCEQSKDDSTGSVTVLMNGEFYSGEIRRLIVELLLPAVTRQMKTNVLKISYSYNVGGERFECSDTQVDVIRTGKLLKEIQNTDIPENQITVKVEQKETNLEVSATNPIKFLGGVPEENVAELQTIDPMGRLKEQIQIAITQSKTIGEALKHNQGLLRGDQVKNTDSLAHLKDEILATIQLYDSIKDSLKSILDAHTPIIKAEIPDDVVKQVPAGVEHDPLKEIISIPLVDQVQNVAEQELASTDSVVSLKHKILEAIHNSNSIQASFKQHQSLLKHATNLMLEKTTGGKLALNEGKTILKDEVQEIDSLENLKAEILTTMRQYDSIKESLKFAQGTLNKDMALQSMG